MGRVLCELGDVFASFAVKIFNRKVRKEAHLLSRGLCAMFYNARAYEIEKSCKAASHAG